MFQETNHFNEFVVPASIVMAEVIIKTGRPFTDSEFAKKYMVEGTFEDILRLLPNPMHAVQKI